MLMHSLSVAVATPGVLLSFPFSSRAIKEEKEEEEEKQGHSTRTV